jgi:hypothetical protein
MRNPEYHAWNDMIRRCTDPRTPSWKYYGPRGIRVCARWRGSLAAFRADLGRRPGPGYTLDRIDNDGHYSCGRCDECRANGWPANCRWATRTEQMRNTRRTRRVVVDGRPRAALDIGESIARVKPRLFVARVASGWSLSRAASEPVNGPPPSPASVARRASAVTATVPPADALTSSDIATRTGIPVATVGRWLRAQHAAGAVGVWCVRAPGRYGFRYVCAPSALVALARAVGGQNH